MTAGSSAHAAWLWALAGLFALRVVAQPLAGLTAWLWLPAFDTWQSGALPYLWLVGLQAALLAWMAWTARRVGRGETRPSRPAGRALALVAMVYGGGMAARMILGLTWFRGHWWLDQPLPTLFHLVITTFLAVTAHYHLREQPTPLPLD